ncbi:unnamed protein product [Acanthoscelides obtectus]|uniref:Uncharacterized protein n=1 Tax=Acanthoscelides obtectus TaxID=200917 RepID=A0A9P0M3W1_ACAOB|nr:unnamed protein product [Acanthoscelides obtectus]CAK1658625.1 hypothetical protein AOBTE_LOCUS21031 [Acanthoscelides obtectus]
MAIVGPDYKFMFIENWSFEISNLNKI